jgi:hypothetical protein
MGVVDNFNLLCFDAYMSGNEQYEALRKEFELASNKYQLYYDDGCRVANARMCPKCYIHPKFTKEVDKNSVGAFYVSCKLSCRCHSTEILGNDFGYCLEHAIESWNSDMIDLEYDIIHII